MKIVAFLTNAPNEKCLIEKFPMLLYFQPFPRNRKIIDKFKSKSAHGFEYFLEFILDSQSWSKIFLSSCVMCIILAIKIVEFTFCYVEKLDNNSSNFSGSLFFYSCVLIINQRIHEKTMDVIIYKARNEKSPLKSI